MIYSPLLIGSILLYAVFVVVGLYVYFNSENDSFVMTANLEVWYNKDNDEILIYNSKNEQMIDKNHIIIPIDIKTLEGTGYEKVGDL